MRRSKQWLVACITGLLVFATPLLIASAVNTPDPEIRLIRTGDRISALIVTNDERVLLINSADRGETRSAIGRLARPWESVPHVLVAPADDRAATGLWEAMRHPEIERVIIVGLPGSDPVWSTIEREAKRRGIPIDYVQTMSKVTLPKVPLTIDPGSMSILAQHGDVVAGIALGDREPALASTVWVLNDAPEGLIRADLLISARTWDDVDHVPSVSIPSRDVVRIVLQDNAVHIKGGRLIQSDAEAN